MFTVWKQLLFRIHGFIGITLGAVLAIVGLTGAILCFQDELIASLNPELAHSQDSHSAPLPPSELIARLEESSGRKVSSLWSTGRILFAPSPNHVAPIAQYVDRSTGQLYGRLTGQAFFEFTAQLHHHLAMGFAGRLLTRLGAIMLVVFVISGLYLRWPRQTLNWRVWLTLNASRKGRGFLREVHYVLGTWCALFYLLSALTGLYWSIGVPHTDALQLKGNAGLSGNYESLRHGRPALRTTERATNNALPIDYAMLWTHLSRAAGPQLGEWNLRLPATPGQPAMLFYLTSTSANPSALSEVSVDTQTGQIKAHARYEDQPLVDRLLISNFALHVGSYFGIAGRIALFVTSACMPLFFITGWMLFLTRKHRKAKTAL